jgi:hypothetical protein
MRRTDELDRVRSTRRCAIPVAQAHTAKAEGRNFQIAFAEYALLHVAVLGIVKKSAARDFRQVPTCAWCEPRPPPSSIFNKSEPSGSDIAR